MPVARPPRTDPYETCSASLLGARGQRNNKLALRLDADMGTPARTRKQSGTLGCRTSRLLFERGVKLLIFLDEQRAGREG